MELWFFYAVISLISIGLNWYLVKVLTDRKVEGSVFTFLQGMTYLVFGFIHTYIIGESIAISYEALYPLFLSISIALIIFINIRLRVRALKYLSSSEYYIAYRILLTMSLAFIGTLFLDEIITNNQLFGLILWSMGIVFLFEDDGKLRHSRNWRLAITLLLLSIGAGIGIQIFGKMQWLSHFSLPALIFYQWFTMLILAWIIDRNSLFLHFSSWKQHKANLILGILATILVYISAICVLYAYKSWGSMSVITKITAYSLFIPIILSIVFSGERVTYKKVIAFILTIVSLYYMG